MNILFRYHSSGGLRRAWCQTRGSSSDEYGINRRNVLHAVRDFDVFGGSCLHLLRICHTAIGQAVCTSCGAAVVGGSVATSSKSKVAAGLLAIFLGGFGIHKFYLGYTTPAVIMLVGGLIGFCGSFLFLPLLLIIATSIVGFIEGIIYLTKSDAEFEQIYVQGTRDWF